jgi:PAS domain S-box-containing protein
VTEPDRVRLEQRLLVLAPTSKDAALTRSLFDRAGVPCLCCRDLEEICTHLETGAGAVLLPEEAIVQDRRDCLTDWLARQPPWSDLPILVLAQPGADSVAVAQAMDLLGNVTVLERPTRVLALVSAVRMALRARQRQYQIRDHLAERVGNLQAKALLGAIVASSDDAIVSKTLEGNILSWSLGAERLFGYSATEAIGQHITLLIPPERYDEETTLLERLRRGERIEHFETVRVAKDGRRIDISLTLSPVRDAEGRIIAASKVARDITQRKHAEAALFEAHDELGKRVEERTSELAKVNEVLKAEIEKQKQMESAHVEVMQQLINAKEAERHRIARELHDQMGQHLTALILGLKVLRDGMPESSPARERLQHLQEIANVIGKEVHHLALELRPTALDDFGLHTTLVNYVESWSERSGVRVDFHSTGLEEDRLPLPIETALYRMVQEGLTNVLKHAQARRVSLILRRSSDHVLAILEDDGCGFDAEAAINSHGHRGRLGLLGMRERVALVGGTLTIESTSGKGATIFARIPLPAYREENGDG